MAGSHYGGAFGPELPRRDLWVSPDHAIYLFGSLIPAKHLINGTTIVQVPVKEITYYHIELARHHVVLAEGLPAETYLDTGDRVSFSGQDPTMLHPEFGSMSHYPDFANWTREARGCAPLTVTGPAVDTARKLLEKHVAAATRVTARPPRKRKSRRR